MAANKGNKTKIAIFFVLIIAIYIGFVLLPQWNRIKSIEAEIQTIHENKEAEKVLNTEIKELEEKKIALEEKLKEIDSSTTGFSDIPPIINYLEDILKDRELAQKTLKPVKEEAGDSYQSITVELTVEGSIDNIIDFISYLENSADSLYVVDAVIKDESAEIIISFYSIES